MISNMNILYHGRFQPPHKGHIELVKFFLKKYPKAKIIISLDVRKIDSENPFSFDFRKKVFLDNLKNYKGRLIITSHKCTRFTFSGCLPPAYESARKFGRLDLVIGGPDLPREVKNFWKSKGIKVETVKKRFFDISATEIKIVCSANKLGFSIITNFGCKYNHWYCVWKNFHKLKLKRRKTTFRNTNWDKLEELIKWYPGKKINISGGLDPLYKFKKNKKWWKKLFEIAKRNRKLVDIHTREFVFDKWLLSNVNKFVISFDDLNEIEKSVTKYPKKNKIRLVKVITKDTSLEQLKQIINFSCKYNFQITFKELYGFDDGGKFKKLKKEIKGLYTFNKLKFLRHRDYNVYFMPDNKVYTKFLI